MADVHVYMLQQGHLEGAVAAASLLGKHTRPTRSGRPAALAPSTSTVEARGGRLTRSQAAAIGGGPGVRAHLCGALAHGVAGLHFALLGLAGINDLEAVLGDSMLCIRTMAG